MPEFVRQSQDELEGRRLRRMPFPYFHVVYAILWKDLISGFRSPESFMVMAVFASMNIIIYYFAFGLDAQVDAAQVSGMLWVTLAFTGILGFHRMMAVERESGCIDGILRVPVDRSAVFFGKWLSGSLQLIVIAAMMLFLFAAAFSIPALDGKLLHVVVTGCIGYAALGTLMEAIILHARARELLLPLLMLPPAFPLLMAATQATRELLLGHAWTGAGTWLSILAACDVIFLSLAWMMYDRLLKE